MATGAFWMFSVAVMPLAIGRAIDAALGDADSPNSSSDTFLEPLERSLFGLLGVEGGLVAWVVVILALGAIQIAAVALLECYAVHLWLHAAVTVQQAVLRHATRVGAALPRKIRSGDVVAIGTSDVHQIGDAFEVIGRLFGSVLAFVLVAILALQQNTLLGCVMLIGVPLATVGIAPLLGPLRRRTEAHREEMGSATTVAADIVSGLRVLRGIGGEQRFAARFARASQQVRRAGVRVGRVSSWLDGIELLLPGLVIVAVTWLGARLALAGTLTVGELVAFYGVSAFLVLPVTVAAEAARAWNQALVAAGRVVAVLRIRPALTSPAEPKPLPAGPFGLHDPQTGQTVPAGLLTVIRTSPGAAERLADRLGRYLDSDLEAVGEGYRVALRDADLDEIRRRILVAHHQDMLFSGRLAEEVVVNGRAGRGHDLDRVLWAADAAELVAELPDREREWLTERGLRLSGGQRQRLILARALSVDSDVLVLDQPTSAVDAHTEARIARRVAGLRAGRTTVVISSSPLWAAVADREVTW